jgi:hypothetical protein
MKRYGLLIAVLLLAFSAPAFAAQNVTLCAPSAVTVPNQVQTLTNGTLTPDARGCVVLDISKDTLGKDMLAFTKAGWDSQTRTWLMGSANAVASATVETFFPAQGSGTGTVAATVGDGSVLVTTNAVIRNLSCNTYTILGAAVAGGGTGQAFQVNVNAVDSTVLTCTEIATGTAGCQDTTHSVAVAGSLTAPVQIQFSSTPAGTSTATVPKCTAEIDTAN